VNDGSARMFAQRGKDGTNGTNGTNGKDGTSVIGVSITEDGVMKSMLSNGTAFEVNVKQILQPIVEKMTIDFLQTMGVVVGGR